MSGALGLQANVHSIQDPPSDTMPDFVHERVQGLKPFDEIPLRNCAINNRRVSALAAGYNPDEDFPPDFPPCSEADRLLQAYKENHTNPKYMAWFGKVRQSKGTIMNAGDCVP